MYWLSEPFSTPETEEQAEALRVWLDKTEVETGYRLVTALPLSHGRIRVVLARFEEGPRPTSEVPQRRPRQPETPGP